MGEWINGAVAWLTGLVAAIFEALWGFCIDIAVAIFKGLLDLILWLVGTLGAIPGADLIATYWNQIPWEIRDLALRLGIAEITTIIVSALILRVILQLIPGVRLGS